jgi:hypothetical protein
VSDNDDAKVSLLLLTHFGGCESFGFFVKVLENVLSGRCQQSMKDATHARPSDERLVLMVEG